MRSNHTNTTGTEQGFTIIELMIATLVFSVILVTVTFGVMSFSKAYYTGVNASTTQTAAQSVMDTVTQAIQFGGSKIVTDTTYGGAGATNGIQYFCADNKVYVYRPGVQYMGGAATAGAPGLYQSDMTDGCQPPIVGSNSILQGTNGKQLLGRHMRIAVLRVQPGDGIGGTDAVTQAYTVSIRLAFSSGGDPATDGDDLLCKPDTTAKTNCATPYVTGTTPADFSGLNLRCRSQDGSQFCAVYGLTSSVLQRVDNG